MMRKREKLGIMVKLKSSLVACTEHTVLSFHYKFDKNISVANYISAVVCIQTCNFDPLPQ